MKITRNNISTIVTALAVLVLIAAIPSAVRDTIETGRVYLFSAQFLEDLPERLTGPGRAAYLYGLLSGEADRKASLASGWAAIRDLVAVAIILDAVSQLLIYRQVHPGAAVIVGPVLITLPYAVARALSNRAVRLMRRDGNTPGQ